MSTNKKFLYRRILLKISGEVLQGVNNFGIDIHSLKRIAKEIESIVKIGIQVGLVIGSGNLFRGSKLSKLGFNRVSADQIGILSTIINSLAMRDAINSISSIKTCLMSAVPLNGICEIYSCERAINLLSDKFIVIFAAGTGNPFFTTDSAACLRGIETESDIILKGTKVDGVYSKDPKKDNCAILYKKLTYTDVLKRELKVMDLAAFTLARDYHLPIRVFNINKSGSLYRIIMGNNEGNHVINQINIQTRERMETCIQTFQKNINNIKTGRASPTLLHNIYIEYFGSKTSLRKLSNIIVEDAHTLKINVFDNSITSSIRKAILNSNLDLNPIMQGKDILIPIPLLTEERRKKLIKMIRSDAESSRINIRNIRRDSNDKVKRLLKNKIISEDNEHISQNKIQIMTDEYIKKIDFMLSKKEIELMKV